VLISGPGGDPNSTTPGDFADRVTVHHNIFSNNPERNPQVSGDVHSSVQAPLVDIRNNIVRNWIDDGTRIRFNGTGNVVKNIYLSDRSAGLALVLDQSGPVFTSGNVAPPQGPGHVEINTLGDLQSAISTPPITEDSVQELPAALLGDGITTGVGALPRDAVDANAIAKVAADLGNLLETCAGLGGTGCAAGSACDGGSFAASSDFGSLCCVGGTCLAPSGPDAEDLRSLQGARRLEGELQDPDHERQEAPDHDVVARARRALDEDLRQSEPRPLHQGSRKARRHEQDRAQRRRHPRRQVGLLPCPPRPHPGRLASGVL
jgi:hypothetical protein